MKNKIQDGKTVDWTNTTDSAVVSGEMVLFGVRVGVCETDIASNAVGAIALDGVYEVTKKTGEAWTVGALIYWDDTAKECTTTVGTNEVAGFATEAAASDDVLGRVKING